MSDDKVRKVLTEVGDAKLRGLQNELNASRWKLFGEFSRTLAILAIIFVFATGAIWPAIGEAAADVVAAFHERTAQIVAEQGTDSEE